MLVFAIETSCDETSICLMKNNKIIKHITHSQEIHSIHGGVVPELASRSHLEKLQEMTIKLFKEEDVNPYKIDVFAATCGPGLIGSLLVGSTFAKSLAISYNKPFFPVNHLEGHILSTSFNNNIKYPNLNLLLTGGHTQIYLMKNENNIRLLGETIDDAVGEAFDKVAKLLELKYPGGSEIEKKASEGDENSYNLPKPLINENNYNFSFSGLKTHINLLVKKNNLNGNFIQDLSASFQKTVSQIIITKLDKGLDKLHKKGISIKSLSVVGGVSNNNYIRKKLENLFERKNIEIYFPLKEMMSDNAAMIAWVCIKKFDNSKKDIFFKPDSRLQIKNIREVKI